MATSTSYGTGADYTDYSTGGTSDFDNYNSVQRFGAMSMDPLNLTGRRDKSATKNPYGTLNPEQIAMAKYLGPYIGNRLAAGPQYYEGQLSAEMAPEEAGYYNSSRAGLLSNSLDKLIQEGTDQTALNESFNREVANPTYQNFTENELPSLLEGYSGFSTAGANARARALNTLSNNLMTQRFNATQAAKDRSLNAYNQVSNVSNYLSIPRSVKQAGLDRQYQEYVRGNSEVANNINNALSFLGLSTGTYQAGQQDNRMLGLVSSLLGSVGSLLGRGSSSTTNTTNTTSYGSSTPYTSSVINARGY